MNITSRDHARELINDAGITSENVTRAQLSVLWHKLAPRLRNTGNYSGTYAMKPPITGKFMTCRTGQWDGREAVSFNRGGFIGIAGWADNSSVQPILSGIGDWLDELKECNL